MNESIGIFIIIIIFFFMKTILIILNIVGICTSCVRLVTCKWLRSTIVI